MARGLARMFVRDLTILDAAYFDDFQGPLGISWQVDAELVGGRDEKGMLFDFRPSKQAIKKVIDARYDHTLICPEGPNPGVQALAYECPEEAISRIPGATFSKAALETAIKLAIEAEFRQLSIDNILSVEITLRDEVYPEGKAWYQYTHGLKHHGGNCQRLWHGHKNRIDLSVNGMPDPEMEREIADLFFRSHIAFHENCDAKNLRMGQRQDHLDFVEVEYQSSQGRFWARIPGPHVVVVPDEPTIENLASFVMDEFSKKRRGTLEVKVYEGIHKGARLTRFVR